MESTGGDKELHDITACIYKTASDRPVAKWSLKARIPRRTINDELAERLKNNAVLTGRTKELGITHLKRKLQYKWTTPDPEFTKGRIFAIDSPEQFEVALPLLQAKHELIGKSQPAP